MKKVSVELFFAVLWRGVCQALEWFFGLFGYKHDGKYAKIVWGVFATSAAILISLYAFVIVTTFCEKMYDENYKEAHCYDPGCAHSEYLGKNFYFHNTYDGKGYVFNHDTDEKTLQGIEWIARSEYDSLVCFSDGKKRGYFNRYTGEVVIPAKFSHAWTFSEGLACVEEDGKMKFIDSTGKTVIDNVTTYIFGMDGLFFHHGHCAVEDFTTGLCCIIDKTGAMVLPKEYQTIKPSNDYQYWLVYKGEEQGVLDKDLNFVIPMTEGDINIDTNSITMTMPDHTIRMYDLQGNIIQDFCIAYTKTLKYEKEEIVYRDNIVNNNTDSEIVEYLEECYHPKATAKMRSYVAGMGYEGLMTPDGHRVTMPIYEEIEAIGPDTYLCTVADGKKVIVNGKGEIMK